MSDAKRPPQEIGTNLGRMAAIKLCPFSDVSTVETFHSLPAVIMCGGSAS